ncbi:1-deoxy-D-xylulose-5-phosphate synthase [Chloroflexota bacterium]
MPKLLDNITNPDDLKSLSATEIQSLAVELRHLMVDTVTDTGGHLASNLGVVELTIALHRVFDSPKDRIIWDVGHQAYVHKLLTGRRGKFASLRQFKGISGYTCREESEHDPFGAGHASTSISAALGIAKARDILKQEYEVVAVIGDGAITSGMAFEALNNGGHLGSKIIVVLNDNGMSISPTVGALARLFNRVRFDQRYYNAKERSRIIMSGFPMGEKLWNIGQRIRRGLKWLVLPTMIWEELGFAYIGPIDGHDVAEVERSLVQARDYSQKPTFIHVITTKGKGYTPAESDAVYFHGISAKNSKNSKAPTYSDVFAATMHQMMKADEKVVVITPAMPEGNCLGEIARDFPTRFFDVGICEQHAVTFAAGMATEDLKPVVAIYSTFLQRSFDQIIHDVCLQELPVVFAIDRGGIVGDDGKTHQGTFDLSYLTLVPNLVVAAPKDENELQHLLYTGVASGTPFAVRYPRDYGEGVALDHELIQIPIGKGEVLREGGDIVIVAIGSTVAPAMKAAEALAGDGVQATVVNARYAKPLDEELLLGLAEDIPLFLTVEENTLCGGFGAGLGQLIQRKGKKGVKVHSIGITDEFVEHGPLDMIRAKYDLDAMGILRRAKEMVELSQKQASELLASN